jgi:hypothetical protein
MPPLNGEMNRGERVSTQQKTKSDKDPSNYFPEKKSSMSTGQAKKDDERSKRLTYRVFIHTCESKTRNTNTTSIRLNLP